MDDLAGGQDYLVSVSDLMASLIFVFIITLMIFVLRFETATSSLQSAQATRTELILILQDRLADAGLDVQVDTLQGILRLTGNSINFAFGATDPISEHEERVADLALIMEEVLPCFVSAGPADCDGLAVDRQRNSALLSIVLIEGHTDAAPVGSSGRYRDNVELSGLRAASVHRLLNAASGRLADLRNELGERVLSISGYGSQRLIPELDELDDANRRIDLRFLMQPSMEQLGLASELETRLETAGTP